MSTCRGWGHAPIPLLPLAVRERYGRFEVPAQVCAAAGVSDRLLVEDLGASVWDRSVRDPEPLAAYAAGFFEKVWRDLRGCVAVERNWRAPEDGVGLPFSGKSRRRIEAVLGGLRGLPGLTFGAMGNARAVGWRTALDIACVAEAVSGGLLKDVGEVREPMTGFAGANRLVTHPLAEEVVCGDWLHAGGALSRLPRDMTIGGVGHLVATGHASPELGSLALEVLERAQRRARKPDLWEDWRALVWSWAKGDLRLGGIVLARTGWGEAGPLPLEEVARRFGVSPQAASQAVARLREKLARHRIFLPSVRMAVEVLEAMCPVQAGVLDRVLVERGLSSHPVAASSVLQVAELLGVEHRVRLCGVGSRVILVRSEGLAPERVAAQARRLSWRAGPVHEMELERVLGGAAQGPVRALLAGLEGVSIGYSSGWFWEVVSDGTRSRNRGVNVLRRMLGVSGAVHVGEFREGLRVWCRRWGVDWVAPTSVLREFARAIPHVGLEGDVVVAPSLRRPVLGVEGAVLAELGRAGGVVSAGDLARRCRGAGVPAESVRLCLWWSPLLRREPGGFCGLRAAPIEIEASAGPLLACQELGRGQWRVVYRVGAFSGGSRMRLRLPAVLPWMPAEAILLRGASGTWGEVRSVGAQPGELEGFDEFLARSGAQPGDVIVLDFGDGQLHAEIRGEAEWRHRSGRALLYGTDPMWGSRWGGSEGEEIS